MQQRTTVINQAEIDALAQVLRRYDLNRFERKMLEEILWKIA